MKKSFLLHVDALGVLNELNDIQAGKLFKAIYNYQNEIDLNPFTAPEDFGLKMAFLPFKNQFVRDGEKYQNIVERNKSNGSKGGRPKKANETEKTQSVFAEPKKAVNVNDNDNDNDNKKDIEIKFIEFWKIYDKKNDRTRCFQKWKKLFSDNKNLKFELLIESAKKYKRETPDPKYRKNPLTWLNGNCWEDFESENEPSVKKYIPTI